MLCCSKKNLDSFSVNLRYAHSDRGRISFDITIHNRQNGSDVILEKCTGRLESTTKIRKSSKNQYRIYMEEATNERELIEKRLTFSPNEKKRVKLQEAVPSHWPPSFAGKWIQYITKLRLDLRIDGEGPCNIPLEFILRTLPSEFFLPSSVKKIGRITPVSRCTMRKMNPFFVGERDSSPAAVSKEMSFFKSVPASKNVFKIQENNREIVRIQYLSSEYALSQKISGILNFTQAQLHCMKFSVSLTSVEVSNRGSPLKFKDERKIWVQKSEVTFGIASTGFEILIPESVMPTFITDLVLFKWCLEFTFYLPENNLELQSREPEWEAPGKVPVTTKTWIHPIQMQSPLRVPLFQS